MFWKINFLHGRALLDVWIPCPNARAGVHTPKKGSSPLVKFLHGTGSRLAWIIYRAGE